MFRFSRILVPLDGSPLAEQALEPALSIAQAMSAELLLLRVVSVDFLLSSRELESLHAEVATHARREAESYLQKVHDELQRKYRVPIEIETISGPIAESIVDAAHQRSIDLIVMSSHGRSGLSRWVYGSIAEKVLRGAHCATLIIRGRDKT